MDQDRKPGELYQWTIDFENDELGPWLAMVTQSEQIALAAFQRLDQNSDMRLLRWKTARLKRHKLQIETGKSLEVLAVAEKELPVPIPDEDEKFWEHLEQHEAKCGEQIPVFAVVHWAWNALDNLVLLTTKMDTALQQQRHHERMFDAGNFDEYRCLPEEGCNCSILQVKHGVLIREGTLNEYEVLVD